MGQEVLVPASMQGKAMSPKFQAALNPHEDNLAAGIGQGYGVIAYKGKVWSLRHRGERKPIIRPDDGTPSAYIDVIILGQAQTKSKSFYESFDQAGSEGARPICASIDGVVPDLDVQHKQAESCTLCPRNVWKTEANGRKTKDCTDYKRLAVLILPNQTAPLFGGKPLVEPVFLRVPPDSLNSLAAMGDTMSHAGHHYASYVTRITFDPNKAHPSMIFRPQQGLTDGEADVILDLVKDPTVARITVGEAAGLGLKAVAQSMAPQQHAPVATGLVAPAMQTAPVTTAPPTSSAPATPPQQPAQQQSTPTPASSGVSATGLGGIGSAPAGAAPPATPTPPTSLSGIGGLGTGLSGGASDASATLTPPQTASQTVADVGAAEESDEELDNRIAGLIKAA